MRRTRLAPSPTGSLHLGNARTFLVNWALARQNRWDIVLRIEDLDTPRTKAGSAEQSMQDLRWLGLDWDQGPYFQCADLAAYHAALQQLHGAGHTYPCPATRSEIVRSASAPHEEDHELRYPGLYRPPAAPPIAPDAETATRLIVPEGELCFDDAIAGPQSHDVQAQVGDFVVATKAGLPAYQLAVVVDDHRQGVTDVVRGDDLLRSAARQLLIYRMLSLRPEPTYWHVPLVLGPDGRRLAKRHGDTRLAWFRERGVSAGRLVALLAKWCGITDHPETMTAAQFAQRFKLDRLPRHPVTFQPGDLAWLLCADG